MDEGDVQTVMRHPTTMIGSDGIPLCGKPHPRLYGTFARVLGHYARELGLFTMEDAVHRITAMPEQKFGLADRGVLRLGAYADLIIFDPATVIDPGTYNSPKRDPVGIPHVFVNGVAVVANGRHTNARPGRALRHKQTTARMRIAMALEASPTAYEIADESPESGVAREGRPG
jgi:N-acyl-D-amino-acid deacylase